MISFRYHIVSIVAVFLALGLGILVGTTVVNQGVIDTLTTQAESAVKRSDFWRGQVGDLQRQVQNWERFGNEAAPRLEDGQLDARPVVLITAEGVDLGAVSGVRSSLQQAKAELMGVLVVTARMNLPTEGDRAALAELLGMQASAPLADLQSAAARALGQRLTSGPGSNPDADLLERMVAGGFLRPPSELTAGGLASVGGPGQSAVIVMGSTATPAVSPDVFFVPLTRDLAGAAFPVVASETLDSSYPFVGILRSDQSVSGKIVTVDDADAAWGGVQLVLGLRNLLVTGRGGDYGVKAGAAGTIIPEPLPIP